MLAAALAVCVPGCGDDGGGAAQAPGAGAPFLTLSEVESVLEGGRVALVRTGGAERHDDLAPVLASARYEEQSGREFDVFVFGNEDAAQRAAPALVDLEEGESEIRVVNVVAVFPEPFMRVDAYRAVATALRRLRSACRLGPGSAEERLRRLCFASDGEPEDRVERDEAAEHEAPVVVDGLHYDPQTARPLNPFIEPDEDLLAGRRPPQGKRWFGVFLRVCNHSDKPRAPTGRIALVDASGTRIAPSTALAKSNPFAYAPRPIAADECLPAEGSAADRVSDGALVLFAVPSDFVENRPIALEIAGADGDQRKRVILDV